MGKTIALITGLLSLIIGISLVGMRVSEIKTKFAAEASVIRIDTSENTEKETSYKPIFRFRNYKNESMIYTPSFTDSDIWSIGERVKIVYTKDRYNTVSILSYWKTFGIALFFFCVAAVAFVIAGGEYLAGRFFKTLNYPNH